MSFFVAYVAFDSRDLFDGRTGESRCHKDCRSRRGIIIGRIAVRAYGSSLCRSHDTDSGVKGTFVRLTASILMIVTFFEITPIFNSMGLAMKSG